MTPRPFPPEPNLLGWALAYAGEGFPVFPVNERKRPLVKGGFKAATTDRAQINEWWRRWPSAGIGVPTGAASGLLVLDMDVRDGKEGEAVLAAVLLVHGVGSLDAVVARTGGGGSHYYMSLPPGCGVRCSVGKLGPSRTPGLDVRGEGGYVVAPPSYHCAGTEYQWVRGRLSEEPAPPIADWLLSLLSAPAVPTPSDSSSQGRSISSASALGGNEREGVLLPWEELDLSEVEGPLGAWARQEQAVQRVLALWGVEAPLGEAFNCVLPGHGENSPSASVLRSRRTGVWNYRDWHNRSGKEWWSLAEVHASRCARQVVKLGGKDHGPSESRWWLRLWHDTGLLAPERTELLLPPGLSDSERSLAEGFGLLLSLRRTREAGPAPYTRRFAADWCGLSEWQARVGLTRLLQRGVITKVDEYPFGNGRKLNLYLPGRKVKELPTPRGHTLGRGLPSGRTS
jgi:putative DNA primase/helicase